MEQHSVLTLTPPEGATILRVQAVAEGVRFTLDGSDPTLTHGYLMVANDLEIGIDVHGKTLKFSSPEINYRWADASFNADRMWDRDGRLVTA
jgi:hypothetical protein